jgi:hypothetical protein
MLIRISFDFAWSGAGAFVETPRSSDIARGAALLRRSLSFPMKRLLPVLAVILSSCATHQQVTTGPIYISSLGGTFPVQGIFEGTFQVKPDHVEVTLPSCEIRVEPYKTYNGSRHITAIKVGLGRPFTDNRWDGFNWTTLATVDRTVQVGDRIKLTSTTPVQIPLGQSLDLKKLWLIVRIDMVSTTAPDGVSYVYAHSPRDIFASTMRP